MKEIKAMEASEKETPQNRVYALQKDPFKRPSNYSANNANIIDSRKSSHVNEIRNNTGAGKPAASSGAAENKTAASGPAVRPKENSSYGMRPGQIAASSGSIFAVAKDKTSESKEQQKVSNMDNNEKNIYDM